MAIFSPHFSCEIFSLNLERWHQKFRQGKSDNLWQLSVKAKTKKISTPYSWAPTSKWRLRMMNWKAEEKRRRRRSWATIFSLFASYFCFLSFSIFECLSICSQIPFSMLEVQWLKISLIDYDPIDFPLMILICLLKILADFWWYLLNCKNRNELTRAQKNLPNMRLFGYFSNTVWGELWPRLTTRVMVFALRPQKGENHHQPT